MSNAECVQITFISADTKIRYVGVYHSYDPNTRKIKVQNCLTVGSEDRLPEEQKIGPKKLVLKEIEVVVDEIYNLRSVDNENTRLTVQENSSGEQYEGTLVACVPKQHVLVLSEARRLGNKQAEVERILEVRCLLPLAKC